jgi:hypothetical protein
VHVALRVTKRRPLQVGHLEPEVPVVLAHFYRGLVDHPSSLDDRMIDVVQTHRPVDYVREDSRVHAHSHDLARRTALHGLSFLAQRAVLMTFSIRAAPRVTLLSNRGNDRRRPNRASGSRRRVGDPTSGSAPTGSRHETLHDAGDRVQAGAYSTLAMAWAKGKCSTHSGVEGWIGYRDRSQDEASRRSIRWNA